MNDALQVFIRGFETQESGERIIDVLENYGFTVLERFDGQSDSRGGLIETDIRHVDFLDGGDDLDALTEAVFAVSPPGTFIQYRAFRVTDEGEAHGPRVKVHHDQGQ